MSHAHQDAIRLWVVEANPFLLQRWHGQVFSFHNRRGLHLSERIPWLYRKACHNTADRSLLHYSGPGPCYVYGWRTGWTGWNWKNRFALSLLMFNIKMIWNLWILSLSSGDYNGRLDCTFVSALIILHITHVVDLFAVFQCFHLFYRNHQRHGKSPGKICGCIQLLGSDGL